MKSAVSSSSSGSERVSGSGVPSSAVCDLEDKSKSNSRMSCASDDSCAINELLEGRMDLSVKLPNSANPVLINVERRTPMLDLLVNISTQYRFNAANYTINAGAHEFKASTPIGTLDVNQISIIPKTSRSNSVKSNTLSAIPFQTTFRLQVNLPRNQLMVLRVIPNATIAAIKQIICTNKGLEANKYKLVRFVGNSEGPQVLDPTKSLAFYTINEVTLLSDKTLSQIELQFGTPSASQVDMSSSRPTSIGASANPKAVNPMLMSQSNPDFTTIDDKTVLNHTTTSKQVKKRPAPPPPVKSSSTLPNRLVSTQLSSSSDEKNATNLRKVESINKIDERVSQTIIETNPVLRTPKSVVNHIRQNSGSDSSGYHESVLSSDSPESSSAATLPKSNSISASISGSNTNLNNSNKNSKVGNKKLTGTKRRAPPPPSTQHTGAQQLNGINDKHNDNSVDESKGALECMSEASLPLSTSSSSSGTASSINNRSLSPIVITETNGSSTPLQTSMNCTERSIESESESAQLSASLTTTKLEERLEESEVSQTSTTTKTPVISVEYDVDLNRDNREVETDVTNSASNLEHNPTQSTQSDASPVSAANNEVDREVPHESPPELAINERETDIKDLQQNDNLNSEAIDEKNRSICANESLLNTSCDPSITSSASNSEEVLPKEVEVSCIALAPALAVSHDNALTGRECVEEVVERDINTEIHIEKPGVNHSINNEEPNQSNECAIDPTLTINNELDLAEMSVPLPPPSPFQNSNPEERNNSSLDCEDEGQTIGYLLSTSGDDIENSDTTDITLNEKHISNDISNEQMINSCDNTETTHQLIEDIIIERKRSDSSESVPPKPTTITTTNPTTITSTAAITTTTTTTTTTANTPLIVVDEETLNKEIEVTLQSLNDELDRLDSNYESESKLSDDRHSHQTQSDYAINEVISNASNCVERQPNNTTTKVSVQVKQTFGNSPDIETIKSKFESRQMSAPSPTPKVTSPVNPKSKSVIENDDSKPQTPISTNGKTTVIVNKSQSPTPRALSPQVISQSPSPTNEDKLSITEEVRVVCRPRVRLTNFSIGSYKKDVDIFEDTPKVLRADIPATAPTAKFGAKSFVTFPTAKKEEKTRPTINQNKSKVNITATSTTATTTSFAKPSIPVIQTLITSAPKVNRMHSWSGQKAVCLEEKNIRQPIKTNERYVSQIAINKELATEPQSPEDLRSPSLVVQNLIAKTEEKIRKRSPSPKELAQKMEPMKEHTTISIKPGLETVIRSNDQNSSNSSNSNENNSEKINNEINSKQNFSQTLIQQSKLKLKSIETNVSTIESNKTGDKEPQNCTQPPVPPPVLPQVLPQVLPPLPPPIPPPVPQNIASFPINNNLSKNKMNSKIFHTKGWNSDKVTRSGEVPKVKHVEPPTNGNGIDIRDQLLNEIKNFGTKKSLKKVSTNTSWKLEVNSKSAKT